MVEQEEESSSHQRSMRRSDRGKKCIPSRGKKQSILAVFFSLSIQNSFQMSLRISRVLPARKALLGRQTDQCARVPLKLRERERHSPISFLGENSFHHIERQWI